MLARVKARSLCLYACDARRCPALRAGEHGGKTEAVSALQLRALCSAGAHLLRVRPRQPVLRGGVREDPPARVVVARRGTLPVEPPRSVWARRPAECLALAPSAESDASGFPLQRRRGHSRAAMAALGSDSISRTLRRPSPGKRRGAPARKRFDLGPKSIVTQSPSLVRRLPDRIDVGLG